VLSKTYTELLKALTVTLGLKRIRLTEVSCVKV